MTLNSNSKNRITQDGNLKKKKKEKKMTPNVQFLVSISYLYHIILSYSMVWKTLNLSAAMKA